MLRKIFGPSKKEVWRKLSEEVSGRFIEGPFLKADKVEVTHGEWTLTLDTYVVSTGKAAVVFTRMRAPYINPEGFRFTIYRHGIFSDIGKWFGMQDIEVGDPAFDDAFIIKGTQPSQAVSLFSDARLRSLISSLNNVYLEVKDDEGYFGTKFPEGVDELCFHVIGVIKDIDQLKLLFDVFAETLDQLCRIGAAYEKSPGITLR